MSKIRTLNDYRSNNSQPPRGGPSGFQSFQSGVEQSQTNIFKSIFNLLFPGFTIKSLNFCFLVTLILVYIIQLIVNALSSKGWYCTLYWMGAKYTYSITHSYHFHRLFMPILLHSHLSHLLWNLIPFAMTGFSLETFLGRAEYGLLLVLGGLTGYLSSAVFRPTDLAVGASTSLYAVFGALCVEFWVTYRATHNPLQQQYSVLFVLMMGIALLNGLLPSA
jgi:membrane associated rhomboid family serine protease